MKKITFEFPKKKEQFKIDFVQSVENNDTIFLGTRFAKPLYKFMRGFCACTWLTSVSDRNMSQIVLEDPDARFIPERDGSVILEVILPDPDAEPCLLIEEE